MADFTAVLRKTIEGLGENTPEVRQKVYAKARTAIAAKLAAVNPPLPPAAVAKQKSALEDAVRSVEAEYMAAAAGFDLGDDLESAIASLEAATRKPMPTDPPRPVFKPAARQPGSAAPLPPLSRPSTPPPAQSAQSAQQGRPAASPVARPPSPPVTGRPQAPVPPRPAPETRAAPLASFAPRTPAAPLPVAPLSRPPAPVPPLSRPPAASAPAQRPAMPRAEPMLGRYVEEEPADVDVDDAFDDSSYRLDARPEMMDDEPPRERRRFGGLIAAVLALLVIAGAAYGGYLYRSEIKQAVARFMPARTGAPAPENNEAASSPAAAPAPGPAAAPEPKTEIAAAEPDAGADAPAAAPAAEPPKFTQRLKPDGSESDSGPAIGTSQLGEGTAVAAVTTPGPKAAATPPLEQQAAAPEPAAPADPAPAATAEPAPAVPADAAPAAAADPGQAQAQTPAPAAAATPQPAAAEPTLAVAQKAIFYEERTSSQQQSAENGTIVWSLVQESPGNDLPPEAAIHAEANIPGRDLKLRMTIRRNADKTLPASHIVEMIFLTPPNFAGGSIDNVLRITLKDTEQTAGSPLIGIPARIADGYFLMALSDGKAEVDTNTALLKDQKWIDIPIVYKSGRRALITMEKGLPGEKVFDDALKAWGSSSSG